MRATRRSKIAESPLYLKVVEKCHLSVTVVATHAVWTRTVVEDGAQPVLWREVHFVLPLLRARALSPSPSPSVVVGTCSPSISNS